ncbi:hypothetical protein HRF36_13900 [Frigoribacterium sp. VKM Ac-2836]|nr:hypothetical protein [Frigoribacterium sp. VKM Ac-2836]
MTFCEDVLAQALTNLVEAPQGPRLAGMVLGNRPKPWGKLRSQLGHLDRFVVAHSDLSAEQVIDLLSTMGGNVRQPPWAHVVSEKEDLDRLAVNLSVLADNLDGDGRATFAAITPHLAVYQGENFNSTRLLGRSDGLLST